nr:EOG090X06Q2 [Macrothrix elegans]
MSSPLSKTEKEKQKLIQEKCQTILAAMLRDEDNKYCVDCDAKGPRWASWNLGIFLCIRCAGIHRNLGVHISRVKSVNLDSWTPEQVVSLQQMGNSRARAVYEANLPDNFRRPQTDASLESFIRAKYEAKKYIAKEWVCPPPVKISWDAEIELELKRKKEAKRKLNGSPAASNSVDLPSSSPPPSKPSSASQDLLGLVNWLTCLLVLDVVVNESTAGNDLFGGLLSTTGSTTNGNATGNSSKNADEDNFFNQKAPSATEKRTLDKNSILALYNQGGTAGTAPTLSAMPNISKTVSFFACCCVNTGVYGAAQPAFGPTPVMNQAPGLMAGGFAPLVQVKILRYIKNELNRSFSRLE